MSAITSNETDTSIREKAPSAKPKLLLVDDDEALRKLVCLRLSSTFEVVDTGNPERAVALALNHKPDAILMDLMMPGYSGFELCQSLHTLSYTSRIPVYIISGESGAKYREHCATLGAKGYFQKPIDFELLKTALANELRNKVPERRKHKRVQMRVAIKLRGTDISGRTFEEETATENLSARGFLAICTASLVKGGSVGVYVMSGNQQRFAGRAKAVRKESSGSPWQRYGFQFLETTSDWVLQDN